MRQEKTAGQYSREMSDRHFLTEPDCKDDLHAPVCSSSLFQFSVDVGLDMDSTSADEQSLLMAGKPRCWMTEEFASADSSQIIDSESADVDDSDVSLRGLQQALRNDTENSLMSELSGSEEWFGLQDQPIAVPVSCDPLTHPGDTVDDTARLLAVTRYADLLQMQLHGDDEY